MKNLHEIISGAFDVVSAIRELAETVADLAKRIEALEEQAGPATKKAPKAQTKKE